MKKIVVSIAAAVIALSAFFTGCVTLSGVDGKDGKDAEDVSIRQIYEETNAERKEQGLKELSFLEFVEEYLGFEQEDVENSLSLQSSINRSLRAAVSIQASFTVTKRTVTWGGHISTSKEIETYYGAGAIIDLDKENGNAYAITNCHVIYNDTADNKISETVNLFLYGQDTTYDANCAIPAKVIGASQSYDIALLKVENSEILKESYAQAASFAGDDDVFIGETVYAIGNPQGYGISATSGIISKESETISINLSSSNYYQNIKQYRVIRTDAAINSGNSGGGLFNYDGYLVGIVNSKASGTSTDSIDNMGFALPSGNVRRLVKLMLDEYNANGFSGSNGVTRAYLTAEYSSKARPSKWNDVNSRYEIVENVYVTVAGDGLETDDAIRHIKVLDTNGKEVENKEVTRLYHIDDTLLSAKRGYTVILTVSRQGVQTDVEVKLGDNKYFVKID